MFQSPPMPQKTFPPMRNKQPLAQSISRSDMPTLVSLSYLANRAISYRGNAHLKPSIFICARAGRWDTG